MRASEHELAMIYAVPEVSRPTVTLNVELDDVTRILRALEETSLSVAPAPGGSRCATVYRRLAADIRAQATITLVGPASADRPPDSWYVS
jgi:hypothetical protein